MAKELFDGIYSSHKIVFIERLEKNLEFYLKNKITDIKRLGQEILCIINKENFHDVLSELTGNGEFNIQILNSINKINSDEGFFLLVNLSSVANNFSLLLKIPLLQKDIAQINLEYDEVVDTAGNFFENSRFFKNRSDLKNQCCDITINTQYPDGLDSFDTYISTDNNVIGKIYFDTDVTKIVSSDFYHNSSITDLINYIGRFDYVSGIFPELCLCMGIEELMQLKMSRRVQYIRMLLSELYRISSHIYFISNISKILGCGIVYNFALIERERILKVIEFITGSRISPNFIRIGGIKKDINEEKLKSINDNMVVLSGKINKIETLLLDNSIVTAKLKNIGIADKETVLKYGVTGPNLRASGIRYDIRKNRNLLLYKDISFTVTSARFGDCLERVQIRFKEIYQSLRIIEQILGDLPEEHIKKLSNFNDFGAHLNPMISNIECPHGVFKIYFEIKGNRIMSFAIMGPSRNSLNLSRLKMKISKIEDMELIMASLDISGGEILQEV
ncbi:MAG: hypothetical protein M1409_03480 [Actinobacteria bacterium]|nr:hypothetical protein [Actinomycetota bacterium]